MLAFVFAAAAAFARDPLDDFLDEPVLYPPDVQPSDDVTDGEIRVEGGGALVLDHTSVTAQVHAGLARVTMVQWFTNPYDVPLEATYLLPLPSMAAVDRMDLTCGDRHVEGYVLPRDEARAVYEQAKADGVKAALLEQQRDNLFTQKVSGLCPGETVEITIQYVEQLAYEDGIYQFAFPMTVGPRYSPPWVEDADALDTPYARTGSDVDLTVVIDEGMPVESIWSDSHDVDIADAQWGATVELASEATIPNADFTLSWSLAGHQPRVSVLANRPDADDGVVALSIEPQIVDDLFQPRSRELLFVLDASCSMAGEPWRLASEAVVEALHEMNADDTFDVVTFSSGDDALFATAQPATAANVRTAENWLKTAYNGGGTNMERGIVRSLDLPGGGDRMRLVLFLTDGYIGGEDTMFGLVREHLGGSRLFALGIGESPNRYLLEGLAEMGRGSVIYQDLNKPIEESVSAFEARIAHPAMTDITVDWGDLDVHDAFPAKIPDLWAGQPLRLVARYGAGGTGTVTVTGRVGREQFVQHVEVTLPERSNDHEALGSLWARRKIRDLEWYPRKLTEDEVKTAITDVAMEFGLVSKYTSLVAVDDRPSRCGPVSFSMTVPHEAPAGMSAAGMVAGYGSGVGYGASGGYGVLFGGSGTSGRLGVRGAGLGGGGTADSLGGLGTKGIGDVGWGTRSASPRPAGDGRASLGGDPVILGGLDRAVIDAVVKRYLNQLRYCYQRELLKKPDLAGKLVVKFAIAADGTVSAAAIKTSTLGDSAVEQCVAGRFLKMQFPETDGLVIVSYPLEFTP
jgi:Ca-activated chloride channel family protein